MDRFCVGANPLITGEHEVHRATCPRAPAPPDRVDLGLLQTGWDAIGEGPPAVQRS